MIAAALLSGEYLLVAQGFDLEAALKRGGAWAQLAPLRYLGLFLVLGAAGAGLTLGRTVTAQSGEAKLSRRGLSALHLAAYLAFIGVSWVAFARDAAPPGPGLLWIAIWGFVGLSSAALLLAAVVGTNIFSIRALGAAAIGALVGAGGFAAGEASQEGWVPLAVATMIVTQSLLAPWFSNVVIDRERHLLGVGDFIVDIAPACGGYEGVGLVTVLVTTFLIAYREHFRFPHALLLLPLGMLAVWLGNAARIAVLIAVGALVDPELAVGGFHGKIGWVFFTAIALGVAALGHHAHFFARDRTRVASDVENPAAPYLMPLLALMGTALVTSTFANPIDHNYWLRALIAGGVLVLFRNVYRGMDWRVSWRGPVVGFVVAVGWLAPFAPAAPASVAATVSTAWLVSRVLGSALVVPICEELAFRGYLLRRLQGDFTAVSPRAWTWLSLLGSSLVFGALHDRWLAGTLAGVAYAALLLRSGRLGEAVAAHAVTNGTIALWVLVTGDWSHWL